VGQALDDGELPLMLGGDQPGHGLHQRRGRPLPPPGSALRVIWLDAHADCNTPAISPSGNLHGMPVASLCGLGPELLAALAGRRSGAGCRPLAVPDRPAQRG
jgi:arginase